MEKISNKNRTKMLGICLIMTAIENGCTSSHLPFLCVLARSSGHL